MGNIVGNMGRAAMEEVSQPLNALFIITAIFHFFIDGLLFRFNRDSAFGIIFWVYFTLAVFAAFFFFKNEDNVGGTMKSLFFCIIVYLMSIYIFPKLSSWLSFNPGLSVWANGLYVAVIISLGYIFSRSGSNDTIKNISISFLLSALAIYLPYLKTLLVNLINPPDSALIFINGILLFTGVWPLYLWRKGNLTGKTKTVANFYMNAWLLYLILIFVLNVSQTAGFQPAGMTTGETDVGTVLGKVYDNSLNIFSATWQGVKKAPAVIKSGATQAFNQSTGQQYYQGEVEKNANQKIGVYLENIKEADPFNYENQEILIWATVKARAYEGSANENNDITITPSCVADRFDNSLKKDGVIKQKQFTVSSYDEQDLDCSFPVIAPEKGKPKSLTQGEHTITFNAQFNFTTKAYKKAYFTDYELLRSLNRENIDIFQQYNLEKNPKAVYTNGPIEIGMETQDIITIKQDDSRSPTIGFSLRNRQTGDLKRINKISLSLPAGLEIAMLSDPANPTQAPSLDCNKKFIEDKDLSTQDSNVYSLSNEEYKNNNKEELQSFRCTLKIASKDALMDKSPVVTRYFQIDANYEYELHGSRTITVKPAMQ